jgi:hypothetical protein
VCPEAARRRRRRRRRLKPPSLLLLKPTREKRLYVFLDVAYIYVLRHRLYMCP